MIVMIIRRLIQSVIVMLTVGLIAFIMFRYVGDPIAQIVFEWIDAQPEKPYTGKYQGAKRGDKGPRFES